MINKRLQVTLEVFLFTAVFTMLALTGLRFIDRENFKLKMALNQQSQQIQVVVQKLQALKDPKVDAILQGK